MKTDALSMKGKEIPIARLNGKIEEEDTELLALMAINEELRKKDELEFQKAQLEASIAKKRLADEEKREKEIARKREELISERENLLLLDENWQKKATMYKMANDIDKAMDERMGCLTRVAQIDIELGNILPSQKNTDDEKLTSTAMTMWEKVLSHTGSLIFAVALFLGLSWFSYYNVELIGDEINEYNKAAQAAGDVSAMLPPSISQLAFQKAWFSWMNIFTSLIGAIAILAVIAPAQLIFILPFTQTPKQRWKHFFEQSEEQKQWQSFGYVAAVLLFLALCHVAVS